MPFVLVAAAVVGLAAIFGRRTSQGGMPSSPVFGQTQSYVGPDGVTRTATWNGSAWVVQA